MANNTGYNTKFLGSALALPKVNTKDCAPRKDKKGYEIVYTHFSIYQHRTRLLPLMAAVNISGEAYSAEAREGSEAWDFSDQVDEAYQLDGSFYKRDLNTFDRGHIVRRVDPCWGPSSLSTLADKETFNWCNCTPQHKKLNQRGGAWFELEQHVMENGVKNKIADICVFSGPILADSDLVFKVKYRKEEVQIPVEYWKVIVWKKSNGKLYAVGFVMSQWEWIQDVVQQKAGILRAPKPILADDYFENIKFKGHATYQVPVSEIEKATGIKFNWKNVTFPYKKKTPQKVAAKAVKKIIPTRTVLETKQIKEGGRAGALRGIRPDSKPVSKQRAMQLVRTGQAPLVKRYNLGNITL